MITRLIESAITGLTKTFIPRTRLTEQLGALAALSGGGIDPDEHLYRRLTGSTSETLSPLQQDRVLGLARYLYEGNPVARRVIELTKDFVIGDGFTLSSPIPEIQEVLTRFWDDPISNLELTQHQKALELGLFGEQIWPVFVNEISGHVRLGMIDPADVGTVYHDPENKTIPVGVTLRGIGTLAKRYRIIYSAPDQDLFTESTIAFRDTFTDGPCFYFAVNKLTGMQRGRSDLLCLMDWLDGLDRYLFDSMERAALINAFVWDVLLKGATDADVQAWLSKNSKPPPPGTVWAHNENQELKPLTADLKQQDTREGASMLRNHVLGGAGIPVHWYSEGEDVNRASATEMSTPVLRRLKTRQFFIKAMFLQVARYAVARAIEPIPGRLGPLASLRMVTLPGAKDEVPATEAVMLQESALSTKDLEKSGQVLLSVAQAVTLLVTSNLMKPETGVRLVSAAANDLGVDINPQEELIPSTDATLNETDRLYGEIQSHLRRLQEITASNGRGQ